MGKIESLAGYLRKTVNTSLRGGVAPGVYAKKRVGEIARELADRHDLYGSAELSQTVRTDWYSGEVQKGKRVSIEEASDREIDMKNALDDAVDDENRYPSEPGRVSGDVDAPCRVLKRRSWS